MKVAIACDHAGFPLKGEIVKVLGELGVSILDYGTDSPVAVDYPDTAAPAAEAVSRGEADRGILLCGSGVGMAILANKYPGVRAALCYDLYTTEVSRKHNDANILILGGRVLEPAQGAELVRAWFAAEFEGGRHARRLEKLRALEARVFGPPR